MNKLVVLSPLHMCIGELVAFYISLGCFLNFILLISCRNFMA